MPYREQELTFALPLEALSARLGSLCHSHRIYLMIWEVALFVCRSKRNRAWDEIHL